MKRSLAILISVLLLAVSFAGCSQAGEPVVQSVDSNKISVVATIFPQYDFIRQIAGDAVDLSMLLSPGTESHSFEPTPQDIILIQNCDVFIYVGGDSDSWVEDILGSMDTTGMEVIALMDLVQVVEEEIVEGMDGGHDHDEDEEEHEDHDEDEDHEDEDHDHDDEIEYDEHVWTSPANAQKIVRELSDALCLLDRENEDLYQANTAAYLEQLSQLDADFQEVVSGAVRKTMVFGDRFPFRYFADRYGLDYFAAFPGCSTETEASAATVAFLIDKVADEEIPVVFHIEFSNEKMADTICETTGAEKRLLHSCHNISKADFDADLGYLDLMGQNVEHLKEALQ